MTYPSFPADSYVPNHTEYADLWSQIKIQQEAPQIESPMLPIEVNRGQCTIDRLTAMQFLAQYPDAPPQRMTVFDRRTAKTAVPVLRECRGNFSWGPTLHARLRAALAAEQQHFAHEIAALSEQSRRAPDWQQKELAPALQELRNRSAALPSLVEGLLWRAHRTGIPEAEWLQLLHRFQAPDYRIVAPDGSAQPKRLHDLLALLYLRITSEHLRQIDADLASGVLKSKGLQLPALSASNLSPRLDQLISALAAGTLKAVVVPSQQFAITPGELQPALYDHSRRLIAIRADFFVQEGQLATLQWFLTHELGHAARALTPTRAPLVDIETPEYELQWRATLADWGFAETRKYNTQMDQLATRYIDAGKARLKEPWTAYLTAAEKQRIATLLEGQRVHAAAFAHAEAAMRTGQDRVAALWERLRAAIIAVDTSALVVGSLRRLEIPYPRLVKQHREGGIVAFDTTWQVFNPDLLMVEPGHIEITSENSLRLETPQSLQQFINTNRPHYAQAFPWERVSQPEEAILDMSQAMLTHIALVRLQKGEHDVEAKTLFELWFGFLEKSSAARSITVRYE